MEVKLFEIVIATRMNSTVVQGKVVLSENRLFIHSVLWAGQSCVSHAFQSIHLPD